MKKAHSSTIDFRQTHVVIMVLLRVLKDKQNTRKLNDIGHAAFVGAQDYLIKSREPMENYLCLDYNCSKIEDLKINKKILPEY